MALATLLCGHASAQVTLTVGPNINITRSPGDNWEECIAINPANPANLFASETGLLATRYSFDGGITWSNSNLSTLPASIGDVSAAFDTFGNLFLIRLDTTPLSKVDVCLSTNGGATFSLLYATDAVDADQPTVATGPSSVSGQGSVWIIYTTLYSTTTNKLAAQGAAVTGLGLVGSFSPPQMTVNNGDYGDIAVGPNGQVLVVYENPNNNIGPAALRMNLDADGLGSGLFGPVITATTTQIGSFVPIPAQPQRDIDAEAGLAWDRSGGPHTGRVYFLYGDRPNTSSADTDIYVRYSDDNGSTWSSRVRVNDDPAGNGKSQFLPRIALDQTTGNIAVSFYDCRNSVSNNTVELWASVSTDGGQTFLPNIKVSAGVSSALVTAIVNSGVDFGDYSGLAFHAGTFYPCWADNSNSTGDNPAGAGGKFDMYTARVTVMPPLIMLNPRLTNSTFYATVQTVAMKTYFLDSTPALINPVWSSLASVEGDGTRKDLTAPIGSSSQSFYRIREQ
jgi:hypothetical protein